MGVTAASLPPVIITSASSYWMVRKASPMALVALAQAVTTAALGPRSPYWIESCPLAALAISLGMVKARDLVGPFVQQPVVLGLDLIQPADARADHDAAAEGVFLGEVDARVADRVDAGHHGELGEAVEPLVVTLVDVAFRGPIGIEDFAAEPHAVGRGVKSLERSGRRSGRCKCGSKRPRLDNRARSPDPCPLRPPVVS